jgi:hypothetical protein
VTSRLPWFRDLLAGAGPWLAFEGLARAGRPAAGATTALAVLALVRLPRLSEFKILDGAILLFFATLALGPETGPAVHRDGLPMLFLAAAALGSAALGRPCTLQYARRMAGPEWWHNRHFIRVNQVLTLAWGTCFLLAAALARAPAAGLELPPAARWAFNLLLFGGALWLTRVFPLWYRLHVYLPRVRRGLEPYLRAPRHH